MYYKDYLASLETGLSMVLRAGHWSLAERRQQAQQHIDIFRKAAPALIKQSCQEQMMINRNLAAAPATSPPVLRPVGKADFAGAYSNFVAEVSYALDEQTMSYESKANYVQRALNRLGDTLIPMLAGNIQKSIASQNNEYAAGALTQLANHQRKNSGWNPNF